jgi:hypothetical protein
MREKVTEAIGLARTGKKRSEDENRNHTEVTEKMIPHESIKQAAFVYARVT